MPYGHDRRGVAGVAQFRRHSQHAQLRQSRKEYSLRRHAQRGQRRFSRLRIRGDRQASQRGKRELEEQNQATRGMKLVLQFGSMEISFTIWKYGN